MAINIDQLINPDKQALDAFFKAELELVNLHLFSDKMQYPKIQRERFSNNFDTKEEFQRTAHINNQKMKLIRKNIEKHTANGQYAYVNIMPYSQRFADNVQLIKSLTKNLVITTSVT